MNTEELRMAWAARGLDAPLRVRAEIPSTQDEARSWAHQGAPHGAVVIADAQGRGRGRLGRPWVSPPGAGVWLTVVLRPELPTSAVPLITLAAAVAVAAAAGPAFAIKWPNDVLGPSGGKVAGILAERDVGADPFVVLGVGVNVAAAPAGVPGASCLAEEGGPTDRAALAADLVVGLLEATRALATDPSGVLDRWRARSATLGTRVRVGDVVGRAVQLDPDGALVLERDDGTLHRIRAGDVTRA